LTWDVWAFEEPPSGVVIAYPYPWVLEADGGAQKRGLPRFSEDLLVLSLTVIALYVRRRKRLDERRFNS